MRFGDYIREIRRERQWTQPQAAKEIGIEQSYLSKLESGKSYPSEDVFSSLISAYNTDLSHLTSRLFPAELDQLREISLVRASILERQGADQKRTQHWLVAGICTLTLGGACLGMASLAQETEIRNFLYKTQVETTEQAAGEGLDTSADQTDELFLSIQDYRGVVFFEDVPEGRRIWRFYGSEDKVVQSPLRWFMAPAIALIMSAMGFFFASYRVR